MDFKIHLSQNAIIITTLVIGGLTILLIALVVKGIKTWGIDGGKLNALLYFGACLIVILVLVAPLRNGAPLKYSISEDNLLIKRLFHKDVVVPFKSVVEIKKITKNQVKDIRRIRGTGGYLGYYGKFLITDSANTGKVTLFAGNLDELIILSTKSEKIGLSDKHGVLYNTLICRGIKSLNTLSK